MSEVLRESDVEAAALSWFEELGYSILHGPHIAPNEIFAERQGYDQVALEGRLREALERLNPEAPPAALDEASRKILHPDSPSLVVNNRRFHRMLVDGVTVEVPWQGGGVKGERVRLVDFNDPDANDWLVVNQFTVIEGQVNRRPDALVFLNGLPLAVIELKNPADEEATIWTAFNQLQTYKAQISSLFTYNEILLVSDGLEARFGSLTASKEWFLPWRTIEGEDLAPATMLRLEVLIRGMFEKGRFLDLIRHFVIFEEDGEDIIKKIAGYHQFHATRKAVETTVLAASPKGDRRAGVVWHTQGSGKSLTMLCLAGKLIVQPEMENPTIVLLTDRNDLDDQLFGIFARSADLLRQAPINADNRAHLRELLKVASGGVVFTTIQKFFPDERGDRHPLLSDRRNIVVIADEAHRSQYDFIDGFARHMRDALPNATFIGFTGTPIELGDRNTQAVFGDHISIYDIQRAVEDGATVPIYYESRLADLVLDEKEKPRIDEEFEEVTEGQEQEHKEKLKTKWAALEKIVGSERRLNLIARDLVRHFDERQDAMVGKAMVVCMSRRICVDLYNAITALRPEWHSKDDGQGRIKIVMTGSASDPVEWQDHIRNKPRRGALAKRFKDADDSLTIGIVRDMWLTGFNAPSLHTMYVDKPMRGHGLMQAIARVNRVFRDKPGGLVVDYLGLADSLRHAMAVYTQSGGKGQTAVNQSEAVAVMLERYEICRDLFHGFDYSGYLQGTQQEKLGFLPSAQEYILAQEDGKDRFTKAVVDLSKAFALAVPRQEALDIRDEVAFFQTVKAALVKRVNGPVRRAEEIDHAIRQILSKAIVSEEVIDIFQAAGLKKPDISLLSEEFLAEVKGLPHKNLAVELLRKLLNDEIRTRTRKNLVQSRSFADMLEQTLQRYRNRAIETAQVIEELIALAKQMREAHRRGEDLGLTEEELAFYDALETNDSAVRVLGDEVLRKIAQELATTVRKNATIDWTLKESTRANLRRLVKRLLRKYKYPPDKQEKATQTVLSQAELFGYEVAEGTVAGPWPGDQDQTLPLRRLPTDEVRPFENCVPLYDLKVAAGRFSEEQQVDEVPQEDEIRSPENYEWVELPGRFRPERGLFVAQVVGESMNRRIPNGSWCLFRLNPAGTRQGKIVLVQHRDIHDADLGGQFTIKRYESEKEQLPDGSWRHTKIVLKPDTDAYGYEDIVLAADQEGGVLVVAELVAPLADSS
ncbi:MAG: HsdR family type I site-specific deoxyribonuclease [Candidatus Eisenbacteria sp.]|nr:HsdR family type I site-specific deoxyribonuclease [Candidatus Eisenbacteria bacterium]